MNRLSDPSFLLTDVALSLLICALVALTCGSAPAGTVRVAEAVAFSGATVRDRVGSLPLQYSGLLLPPRGAVERRFKAPSGSYALLVRVVVPDDRPGCRLTWDVRINGVLVGRRDMLTEGVGRRSQFIRVDHADLVPLRRPLLEVRNTGRSPLLLESVLVLTGYEDSLQRGLPDSDFILSFLVDPNRPDAPELEWIRHLNRAPGVTMALSSEIPFARKNPDSVKPLVDGLARLGAGFGWPVVPIMVSWWSGTPPEIRERIDFQQVCYSDTDTYDEGQPLRDLLGSAWSIRYGLTVPNRWSSTPWQTMNNPELNGLRKSRLDSVMPYVMEKLGDRAVGIITENEPMYWAGEFPDEEYPVKRENLLADFNPHTVRDAARDGVTLNPSDGLDKRERRWLFDNLHRYIVETASWIRLHASDVPVYTHELLEDHFPMKGSGVARPAMEAAVAPGFIHGVETLWDTNLDKYLRLREFGLWGCVNREEGDVRPVSQHIAMALALYASGASMLNSYNWTAVAPRERAEEYFNGFTSSLTARISASAEASGSDGEWKDAAGLNWAAGADPDCPWGTHLELHLRNVSTGPAEAAITVTDTRDRRITGYSRRLLPGGFTGWVSFPLDSMTDAAQHTDVVFSLKARAGVQARLVASNRPEFRWVLDAAEERRRSQVIFVLRDIARRR